MKILGNKKGRLALIVIGIIFLVLFIIWAVVRIYLGIQFDRHLTGHLKRAADANTIELAIQEMKTAIDYMEKHDLTQGYTSVLYTTPDEDIGFWYTNLKQSLQELYTIKPDATPLEKSNVLMKLRETLLDEGKSISVTEPEGISIYPLNTIFFFWGWLSSVCGVVLLVGGIRSL